MKLKGCNDRILNKCCNEMRGKGSLMEGRCVWLGEMPTEIGYNCFSAILCKLKLQLYSFIHIIISST